MREIKFRGRNATHKRWIYGSYLKHQKIIPCPIGYVEEESDYVHLIIHGSFSDWNLPRNIISVEVDETSVGQYTGLKDVKNKEIYEGDICKLITSVGEERFFEVKYGTVNRYIESYDYAPNVNLCAITGFYFEYLKDYKLYPSVINSIPDNERMEVVGNIYENPQLLEENHDKQ